MQTSQRKDFLERAIEEMFKLIYALAGVDITDSDENFEKAFEDALSLVDLTVDSDFDSFTTNLYLEKLSQKQRLELQLTFLKSALLYKRQKKEELSEKFGRLASLVEDFEPSMLEYSMEDSAERRKAIELLKSELEE